MKNINDLTIKEYNQYAKLIDEGKVDGKVACECDCTFAIMDPKDA